MTAPNLRSRERGDSASQAASVATAGVAFPAHRPGMYHQDVPRVSVVIPAYNPGGFLNRAIASVLSQTMNDLECIVVDDGSKEDLAWVQSSFDGRVRLIRQSNRGVSIARNVGVAAAGGEYVAFLDQDDEWLPSKTERQLESLETHPGAGFSYTSFDWIYPDHSIEGISDQVTYAGLLATQHICLSSVLLERSNYLAVGGHDPLLNQMQDFDLFLRLTMAFDPPAEVPERLVRYHVHGANASSDFDTAFRERMRLLESHRERARKRGDLESLAAIRLGRARTRELYGFQALDRVRSDLRLGDGGRAVRDLAIAAQISPSVTFSGLVQAVGQRVIAPRGSHERG